ncbi:MAG: MFS transporter [Lysobacteraceae bacterium]|nr:MAG: MFS transporter [Xanthomonadaceae bacterium]
MSSQFDLLKQRRFAPFFVTQSLGALNDNVFKQALVILVVFSGTLDSGIPIDILANAAAGLFILPFFLFSATAGQIADKYEKSKQIRAIKLLEVAIMALAGIGFWLGSLPILFTVLFLMGTQSTLFGPLKYAILPQHLAEEELVGGNGLVEMGTFVAILLGMIIGGSLAAMDGGPVYASLVVLVLALAGYWASRSIPAAPAVAPNLKINFNPLTETVRNMKFLATNRTVLLSVLGISWFWFFGANFLTQVPNYTRIVLGGGEGVSVLLMAVFSVGIGVGSLLCERLSGRRVELGLVPFGAIGLTLLTLDTWFAKPEFVADLTMMGFLSTPSNYRLLFDLLGIGMFGGFYIVPLYALIQQRSHPEHRSRVIAGNNILNALFMAVGAVISAGLLANGLDIPELFFISGILNAIVAIYIFSLVPEFLLRFVTWLLVNAMYKVRGINLDRIPEHGAALLVCNHVSFVDALIIGGTVRRPVRFVMYYKFFEIPILRYLFKWAKVIPIAGSREDPAILDEAFKQIAAELESGQLVCIFPEGRITADGQMHDFKPGVERALKATPVTTVPMCLDGLWGSIFSRKHTGPARLLPRRFRARIELRVGEPMTAEQSNAKSLQAAVEAL